MKYIIKALRETYMFERIKYEGLDDLINLAEFTPESTLEFTQYTELMNDINDLLYDINREYNKNE